MRKNEHRLTWSNMQKTSAACIAMIFVVASGVVQRRWAESGDSLRQAVARLENVPDVVGDWKVKQELTIPDRQLAIGEIDGYLSRTYVNETDGKSVNVIIVCGRAGPISVHTPDICFEGQGMRSLRDQEKTDIRAEGSRLIGEFWHCDFANPNAPSSTGVGTFWTWSAGGSWSAPTYPRLEFAGKPYLYKMYVTHALGGQGDPSSQGDPTRDFIAEWIPAVRDVLFPDSEKPDPAR